MHETHGQLHIVTVHGTFSGRNYIEDDQLADVEFFSERSPFAKTLITELQDRSQKPKSQWHEFTWSGKNLDSARRKAAREFRKYIKRLDLNSQDELVILAHSHGGNVALSGLRKAPSDAQTTLYSVGTPYINKRNPSLFEISALLLPGLIFFLAVVFIAAVIANGHLPYIAYGTPFVEPSNVTANQFFEIFNQGWQWLSAIILIIGAAFWFLVLPTSRLFHRSTFTYKDKNHFRLIQIARSDDEAIAMLRSDAHIDFPISIFSSFFRVIASLMFLVFIALTLRRSLEALKRYRTEEDPNAGWDFLFLFEAEIIGLGLTVVGTLIAFSLLTQFIFHKPVTWLLSQPINSILRKSSIGEDGYQRLSVSHQPDIPEIFVESLNELDEDIALVLNEVKHISDNRLLTHRAEIMTSLTRGDGALLDLLVESNLAQALIHCNYFTHSMAIFIAKHILKQGD